MPLDELKRFNAERGRSIEAISLAIFTCDIIMQNYFKGKTIAAMLDRGFWTLTDDTTIPIRCNLTCNDGELAHGWALQGAGLVLKSIWDTHGDIEAGRPEVVLPKLRLPAAPIHAVYPHSRHAAAKVRLCVEFLADRLRKEAASLARFTRLSDAF